MIVKKSVTFELIKVSQQFVFKIVVVTAQTPTTVYTSNMNAGDKRAGEINARLKISELKNIGLVEQEKEGGFGSRVWKRQVLKCEEKLGESGYFPLLQSTSLLFFIKSMVIALSSSQKTKFSTKLYLKCYN